MVLPAKRACAGEAKAREAEARDAEVRAERRGCLKFRRAVRVPLSDLVSCILLFVFYSVYFTPETLVSCILLFSISFPVSTADHRFRVPVPRPN